MNLQSVPGDEVIVKSPVNKIAEPNSSHVSARNARSQTWGYFLVAVLGFSFWFFMAVPFASHRESYEWLAQVHSQDFTRAFSFISKTYRPLAQASTWLGFLLLDPSIFPTSVFRQTLLQGFVYSMFVLAWWLIYPAAPQRRLFAVVAFTAGGVFFSGYVQLFHVYGLFYVPVMLTLGASLRIHASRVPHKGEVWFAAIATLLAFWHPFATALFLGFYFGFYLDTFRQRNRRQHVQAIAILLVGILTIATLVVIVPTRTETIPLQTRLFGFLVSYQTNEVNLVASFVTFLLTQIVVFSTRLSSRLALASCIFVTALSVVFLENSLPLLLLWFCVVLLKLFYLRSWSLFFLMLAAAVLPFGGGIGTPIYGLFAIIVAAYVTPLGWSQGEQALSFLKTRYIATVVVASAIVIVMVRAGVNVPIITRLASPLLTERERTFQLETILAWLRSSGYCGFEISFVENAGSPIDSVENVISRRNRPPAGLKEVRLFWNTVLRCRKSEPGNEAKTAVVTFGGPELTDLNPVFKVEGRYAGDATVWVRDSQK
jgi:hypothetical protein